MFEKMLKFTGEDIEYISLENDFAFETHRWIEGKWIRNLIVEPQKYDYRVPIYYKADEARRSLCPSILVKNFPRAELPKLDVPHVVYGAPKGEDPLEPYYSYYEVGVCDGAYRHKGFQEVPNIFIEFNTFGMSKDDLLDKESTKLTVDEQYTFSNILEDENLAHIFVKFKRPVSDHRMFSDEQGYMHFQLMFEECGGFSAPSNEYLSYGFCKNGNFLISIGETKAEKYAKELGYGAFIVR